MTTFEPTDVTQDSRIRLVVADAHPLFTLGIRAVISTQPNMSVVGEAWEGQQTLKILERTRPDVLLLDLALPGLTGLEVLTRVTSLKIPTRTVVMTTRIEAGRLRTALVRGARGVLLKDVAGDLLAKCVRQVMKGEYWIGRDNVGDLVEVLRGSAANEESAFGLSQREQDIVSAVLSGSSNKDIAWQLGMGEQTVKNRLRRIFAKLGVANRVELAVHAMARQLGSNGSAQRPTG